MNPESISTSTKSLMAAAATSRPALSWCSKCGQSTEISSESNLFKTKTNFKFRKIFDFDDSEVLIKTFSCALVDDMLFQGTLYTSQNHFCFFSRIANKHRKIIISISQIVEITKEKTVGIFPNAIAIKTQHNRHLFASFVYRDSAFRCLTEVWGAHHQERFSTNWNIAFNNGACSKESPLLDLEVEDESLITPIMLATSDNSNDYLLDDIDQGNYCLKADDVPIIDLVGLNMQPRTIYKARGVASTLINQNIPKSFADYRQETTLSYPRFLINNLLQLIFKDQMQIIIVATVIISLILYIIFLAWKIHTLQFALLEQFMSPRPLGGHGDEDVREIIRTEAITTQPSRMSKVQSDLKETLNLLQGVVEISAKIFNRLKTVSLPNIIPSKEMPKEI